MASTSAKTRYDGADGIATYIRQMGPHRQLTREEEYELSRRARKGDQKARETLATSNLPFVVAVAKKYANRGARLDDLIQEGNVGLMKAIEHFDARKNVRFATYAVWWIRAYITRYLKDNRSQVRGGEHERESMADFSLDNTIDESSDSTFLKRLGDLGWDILQERLTQDKPRTLEELGQRWGVSRERVRQVELRTKSFLARYLSAFNQDEERAADQDAA